MYYEDQGYYFQNKADALSPLPLPSSVTCTGRDNGEVQEHGMQLEYAHKRSS